MTRFARAMGSKASNEKTPEDSTPWEQMKEQLMKAKKESEEAKKRQEAEQQRIENYENFLKERRIQKQPATWCDFPEVQQDGNKKITKKGAKTNIQNSDNYSNSSEMLKKSSDKVAQNKENKRKKQKDIAEDTTLEQQNGTENNEFMKKGKKKKNKRKSNEQGSENLTASSTTTTNIVAADEPVKKKKKKEKKNLENAQNQQNDDDSLQTSPKKKKKNKKNKFSTMSNDNETCSDKVQDQDPTIKQNNHKNKFKTNSTTPDKNNINKNNKEKAKKKKKLVKGQPVRRKEINDKSFQLIINGKDVELVRFDGFPIMKKDAERLAELKNSMIKKGIPKSEVQRTMKLERRRAEKALARLKRDVCYNCRKGGHNLSDCPELKSKIPGADGAEGVCFKCGSTEHRQFECKVQRDKEFRFATCFICKEPGHIARQCPDNPKGLYPNGGACKLCGDVTHLRKDCPTQNTKKEETSLKLSTLNSADNIEDIGLHSTTTSTTQETSKKPKKIKF